MRFTTFVLVSSVSLALQVTANPVVDFEGGLFARDTQPLCAHGTQAGCGKTYDKEEDCVQYCYGVRIDHAHADDPTSQSDTVAEGRR